MDAGFLAVLQSEDDLGAVIRAHLQIEAGLNEFLAASVPVPDELPTLTYANRVKLACALGLHREHAPPLTACGALRNRFAHRLDSGLTQTAIGPLMRCLSVGDRAAVEAAYQATNQKVIGTPGAAATVNWIYGLTRL